MKTLSDVMPALHLRYASSISKHTLTKVQWNLWFMVWLLHIVKYIKCNNCISFTLMPFQCVRKLHCIALHWIAFVYVHIDRLYWMTVFKVQHGIFEFMVMLLCVSGCQMCEYWGDGCDTKTEWSRCCVCKSNGNAVESETKLQLCHKFSWMLILCAESAESKFHTTFGCKWSFNLIYLYEWC